jgi:hypothetical protein
MVRKYKAPVPKFYLHYDKSTGRIFSASNEKQNENFLEVPQAEYNDFITGKKKFFDYIIGNIKVPGKRAYTGLIPKADHTVVSRNSVLEWIIDAPNKSTDLTVTWDKNRWGFSLSDKCKKSIGTDPIANLVFFVMLENNFNFLIRTIVLDSKQLLEQPIVNIAFDTKFENDIKLITIASKAVFDSYGLLIND